MIKSLVFVSLLFSTRAEARFGPSGILYNANDPKHIVALFTDGNESLITPDPASAMLTPMPTPTTTETPTPAPISVNDEPTIKTSPDLTKTLQAVDAATHALMLNLGMPTPKLPTAFWDTSAGQAVIWIGTGITALTGAATIGIQAYQALK